MKKKLLCILLATFMLFSVMTGCNGDDKPTTGPSASSSGTRTIRLGTWYSMYYTSQHDSIYADSSIADPIIAQMELDNMRAVEAKHNIRLNYVNMTWDGIQESIITSIMAGQPDADVYWTNLQFGIPAVLNDLAISLESMGVSEDILTGDSVVLKSLQLTGQDGTFLFAPAGMTDGLPIYALGFNWTMLQDKNLENPQDLWDRGEWTWDVWLDYLQELTDVRRDIYGWSGYWTYLLTGLLMSNGAAVADGPATRVTETPTIEVFALYDEIYNQRGVGRTWDRSEWTINNNRYAEGASGFWITADWLMSEQGGSELPFEIGVVPWPTGPNIARAGIGDELGRQTTFGTVSGSYYMIPRGTTEPRQVFDVLYDWTNWFDYDTSFADDLEWARNMFETMDAPENIGRNFDIARYMAENTGFEIWASLQLTDIFHMLEIIEGETAPASYAAAIEPVIQDRLNEFFG